MWELEDGEGEGKGGGGSKEEWGRERRMYLACRRTMIFSILLLILGGGLGAGVVSRGCEIAFLNFHDRTGNCCFPGPWTKPKNRGHHVQKSRLEFEHSHRQHEAFDICQGKLMMLLFDHQLRITDKIEYTSLILGET